MAIAGIARVDLEEAANNAGRAPAVAAGAGALVALGDDMAADLAEARAAETGGTELPSARTLDSFSVYWDFKAGGYRLWKPLAYRWTGSRLEQLEVECPETLDEGGWFCVVERDGQGVSVRVTDDATEAEAVPLCKIDPDAAPTVEQYHTGALVVNDEDSSTSWMSSSLSSSMSAASSQGSGESGGEAQTVDVVTGVHFDGGRLYYYTRRVRAVFDDDGQVAHTITQAVPHCCD